MQNTLHQEKKQKVLLDYLIKWHDIVKYPSKLKHLRLSSAPTSVEQKKWILCINPNHITYLWILRHNILGTKHDRQMSAIIQPEIR